MTSGGIGSPARKKERIDMRTRLLGIAGLALGLTVLGGGAAASAHGGTAVPLSASVSTTRLVGAGLSAPLYQLSAAQDPACATQGQDQTGATETSAANTADADTVDLQCGDQTGADTGGTDSGAGFESAAGTEAPGSGDQAIDGLDQQGQN